MKNVVLAALVLSLAAESLLRGTQVVQRFSAWRERGPGQADPWPSPEELGSSM